MAQRLRDQLRKVISGGGPGSDAAEIALANGSVRDRLEAAILALTQHRGPDSSICPSDAARAIGGENWRDSMDDARAMARELAKSGDVQITARGEVLDPDGDWRGPIRIRTSRR